MAVTRMILLVSLDILISNKVYFIIPFTVLSSIHHEHTDALLHQQNKFLISVLALYIFWGSCFLDSIFIAKKF